MRPGGTQSIPIAVSDTEDNPRDFIIRHPLNNTGLAEYRLAESGQYACRGGSATTGMDRHCGCGRELYGCGFRVWGPTDTGRPAGLNLGDRRAVNSEFQNATNRTWRFEVSESGTYTISFHINSAANRNNISLTRTITVEAPEPTTGLGPHVIWGTVLIVISAALLLGVIVYFIMTGRKTKFIGGPTPSKPVKASGGKEKQTGFMSKFQKPKQKEPKALNVETLNVEQIIDNPEKE
jgi:hypothetical protein